MMNDGCMHQEATVCDECRNKHRDMLQKYRILTLADYTPTLRDRFAAAALTGLLAKPDSEILPDLKISVADKAYRWADAMLMARERLASGGEG